MRAIPTDFMTLKEAAKHPDFSTLLRSVSHLRRLAAAERVRVWKIGGKLMFSRAQLAEDLHEMMLERRPRGGRDANDDFISPRLAAGLATTK